jgi:DNA-directed RNA polymerase specialized sigma24 family protein
VLDPARLPDHVDALYRAAWALCGSPHDAEDLVQTTFAHVLRRPRIIRSGNERGYLLRALRNTYSSGTDRSRIDGGQGGVTTASALKHPRATG